MYRQVLSSKYYLIIAIVALVFRTSVVSAVKNDSEATENGKQTNIFVSSNISESAVKNDSNATENDTQTNIFVSSRISESSVNFIQIVNNHQFFLEKNTPIKIKAYIEPITTNKKIIYAKKELSLPEQSVFCKGYPCTKKLYYDFSDKPIDIKEFTHAQFSWTQSEFGPMPEILFEAELSKNISKNEPLRIRSAVGKTSFSLKQLKTINMKEAQYAEKSIIYLTKRELGLEGDDKWYHSVSENELILQSRVNLPLKKVQTVKVLSESDLAPRVVQFSIDSNGNGCRDGYILFNQIRYTKEVKNAESILSIDLRPAIKALGIDINKTTLMEVIVFIPTTFKTYLSRKPLNEISFFCNDRPQNELFVNPKVKNHKNHYTIDLDFSSLANNQLILNSKIINAKITTILNNPQFIKWNSIFFYNSLEKDIASLIDIPGMAISTWDNGNLKHDQLNKIASFRPLAIYRFHKPNKKAIENVEDLKKEEIPVYLIESGLKQIKPVIEKWHSIEDKVKGKLWYSLSGKKKNSSVNGWIRFEQDEKRYPETFSLVKGSDWLNVFTGEFNKIRDFSIKGSIHVEKWPFQIALFDVQSFPITKEFDYRNYEWWINEAKLDLALKGKNFQKNKNDGKLLLYPERQAGNKWEFLLPKEEFIFPLELIIPGPLPKPCRMILKVNNDETPIPYGPYVLPLTNIGFNGNEFKLSIEYLGTDPIIWLDIPVVKVMGLKQTPIHDLSKLMVVIDDIEKQLNLKHLPDPRGEWIDMGKVRLDKGSHSIQTINSKFFKIKSLALESGAPISLHYSQSNSSKIKLFRGKIYIVGIKIALIILICALIYILRTKIKYIIYRLFRHIRDMYIQLDNTIVITFWTLLAILLYCIGIITNISQKENYYYTIGGIAVVMVMLHFSRLVKNYVSTVYPKVASYVYRSLSAIFFTWSIALLIITAFLVAVRIEVLAEQVTFIVYYLLFAGVINKIVEINKKPIKAADRK
jgi:hypothetical protein